MPDADTRATILAVMEVDREDLERNDMPPPERWTADDLFSADRLGLIYAIDLGVPVTDEMIRAGARGLLRRGRHRPALDPEQARIEAEAVLRAALGGEAPNGR
jgi:hypothetical protein